MKTLGEIKRNIVSFYSTIQNKINDFSIGSVTSGLFYAFSSALESAYEELEEVRQQAYIATATGEYLDKLIEGTFQLARSEDTRSVGYVVVFGESPLTNFSDLQLRYAEFDYDTGEFISGSQSSTKFVGYNVQGDEGIVFSLIQPRNSAVIDPITKLIVLDRSIQFLILPVASMLRGEQSNVREGGIYSFPSAPPGLSGVLNTSNPGAVFFASEQTVSSSPFYTRFTEVISYNNTSSSFSVLNAYNFSQTGFVELKSDITRQKPIVSTYSEYPGELGSVYIGGLIFEYIDASTTNITLKLPIENSLNEVPTIQVTEGEVVKTLTLEKFTYDGNTYTNLHNDAFDGVIRDFVDAFTDGLLIEQRANQISPELIFDPDSVLTSDYKLLSTANVSGASDGDTDAEYREALVKYLAGLSKATDSALEAGTLQIAGVSFAKTLPSYMSPRGAAVVLASNDDGYLTNAMKYTIKTSLENEWKAAGVHVIVKSPELLPTNITMTIRLDSGVYAPSVTQQVNITVEEYLKGKTPGDSLRYSDLLEAITQIGGVLNVFNMVVTKGLTDAIYQDYKAQYDEAVLIKASDLGILEVEDTAHGLTGGEYLSYNVDSGVYTVEADIEDGNALVYSVIDANNFEILTGNLEALDSIYQLLVVDSVGEADNVSYFTSVIIDHDDIFTDSVDMIYFLSYVLGEPFVTLPSDNYPINVDNINYQYIRDYEASEIEIFRANTLTIGTEVKQLIGIRYI